MEDAAAFGAQAQHKKQCFAPVQARKKLWCSGWSGQLCPSMDVVVLWTTPTPTPTSSSSSSSIILHRTVSWQRLASFVVTLLSDEDNNDHPQQQQQQQQFVTWSPDGRAMAVTDGSSGSVALHHMEAMLADAASGNSSSDSTNTANGRIHTLRIHDTSPIIINGLTWAHVGRPHSQWYLSEMEMEQEESWSYRSHYLDRCKTFLPPRSSTDHHHHVHDEESTQDTTTALLPSSTTPLSLLCVATASHGIHLYLYGRYHIATLTPSHDDDTKTFSMTTMVCSSNLEHLLVLRRNAASVNQQHQLLLYSMTPLQQHQHTLQTMASLYCSITSSLTKIQRYTQEISASWKAALKPLDVKLEGLVRLLQNYGISDSLSTVLLKYLLVGHTTTTTTDGSNNNVSNVMDQFFTSVQMNDQLIQRLEKTLAHAVAQVETLVRCQLLAEAQSLVYHTTELHSQCQAESSFFVKEQENNTTPQLLSTSCQVLLVTVSKFISHIVEARFRLRDFISWLRSVGSQIKARGTAANSGHRENAKKRRISVRVKQRMASYLNNNNYPHENINKSGMTTTETLLGLPISEFFHEDATHVVVLCQDCPSSPKSVQSSAEDEKSAGTTSTMKTPTIPYATTRVAELVQQVFDQPRQVLSQSVKRTDLLFDNSSNEDDTTIAIQTRIGLDCNNDYYYHDDMMEQDRQQPQDSKGFFCPRIVGSDASNNNSNNDQQSYSRHWAIVAKTGKMTEHSSDILQLFALPMGRQRNTLDIDDDEDDAGGNTISYYLVSRIVLPPHCHVKEVAFYGDDGKSSLSSGEDSGTGQEGRQAIGMLVDREVDNEICHGKGGEQPQQTTLVVSEELWLFRYDNLLFQPVDLLADEKDDGESSNRIVLQETNVGKECTTHLHPILQQHDENVKQDDILFAKTRQLRMYEATHTSSSFSEEADATASRLMLSGSRGIGGIFTTTNGCTTLDLFDLEEDEEESDDEEQLGE